MPIYNFRCNTCDHEEKDIYFTIPKLPRKRKCAECGVKDSTQDYRGRREAEPSSNNSMYGKWQPGAGVVWNSYSEKKQWLKDNNMEETHDLVKGSRSKRRDPPPRPSVPAEWVDIPRAAHL